jgi:hypothetical protein
MSSTPTRFVLIAIALLLAFDIGLRLQPVAPAFAPQLIPTAQAQNRPTEAQLRTGTVFVTQSEDGANLYVWQCTLVNSVPTFQAFSFSAR